MILPETWILGSKAGVFNQRVTEDTRVASVTFSDYLPAGPSGGNNFFISPETNDHQMVKSLNYNVDYNYIPTLGMEMAAGRNFQRGYATDSTGVIINETAARVMGMEKNPIGQVITHSDNDNTKYRLHVIGVVKDFHFKSMHELITPLVMSLTDKPGTMIIKIKTKDVHGLIADMTKWWNGLTGDAPLSYTFLDEEFNNTYRSELKTEWVLGLFAGLTILVACLGLFGLATFTAEQRRKEIGIRKVLGASVSGLVTLLSKDFLRLVAIAFVLAVPLAWYLMHKWLQDYEYRIGLGAGVFIFAALITIVLTLITVGGKSVRAAVANPVNSLRAE
jgi:putative ABC transport system permease protein